MNTSHHRPLSIIGALRGLALSLSSALWLLPALAAQTDISNVPISSTDSAQAKPNIMLLMDTSGSMGWGHMPDEVETGDGYKNVGYKNSTCNTLYYDPAKVYALPKKADGTYFAAPSFTAAPRDPYDSSSTATVDLSGGFQAYYTVRNGSGQLVEATLRITDVSDTAQPAYYYTYTGSSTLSYKTAPCRDLDTGSSRTASDGGSWTKVIVSGSVQQQNFANWFSFYRTRMLLMKSSVSLAFSPLTESFRVGFITMQPKDTPTSSSINADKFLPLGDFNSTQRGLWFDKLFSQKPAGASPAREGLARVGRYYAGMTDGINSGMGGGDPVQFSCQQNFTIMTTDGYWNDQTETPSGGPVGIDGSTRVANQDGVRTANAGLVPPPIWEGNPSIATTTDRSLGYQFSACTSSYFLRGTSQILKSTAQLTASTSQLTEATSQTLQSTLQNLRSTAQNLQSTSQVRQSTTQNLQSTAQNLRSTAQNLQSTSQVRQSTAQALQSTIQRLRSTNQNLQTTTQTTQTTTQITQTVTRWLQSTNQNLRSTSQVTRSTSQLRQSTNQNLRSTVQNLRSTVQNRQSTSQLNQSTVQANRTTTQNLRNTTQNLQNTTQNLQSTAQNRQSTTQLLRSTSQINVSTVQQRQSTTQLLSCDAATELCSAVPTCTPGGLITCQTISTGPTLVASCTPASAVAGNSYTSTTCSNTTTGPTPAASCTAAGATSANNYTATTCNTVTTASVPVASCTAASASSGNSWTTTTCATNSTTNVPVASCTAAAAAAGNNYTATTCNTATTGPTAVASCSPVAASAGNSYTATTCSTNNTSNVPVATCTPTAASSGNSWTATTCPAPVVTTNVPVATCTAAAASSGNSWTATTCPAPIVVGPTPVASCTAAAASAGNSYTATSCTNVTTGPTPTGSCTAVAAAAGNSYTATTCNTVTTTNVPVGTCTAAAAAAGNSWTATTCPAPVVTTNVPVATCTAATAASGNSWTTTTCPAPIVTTNVPVASCTAAAAAAGNSYTTTTCPAPIVTTNVPVASCTAAAAAAGNSYTSTTCNTATTGPTGVSACTAAAAAAGNSYTATTCNTVTTANVPVATCTAAAAAAGNSWTATTCPAPVVTTNVPVATCTAAAAAAGNSYTSTTCVNQTVSGPTVVAACTASGPTAGNGYQTTTCGTITNTVPVATCTPQTPTAGNGYTTITCNTTTNTVPVATCTPQSPTAGNNYTTITCPAPVVTTNVPVATCTAAAAAAGNAWTTTTCPAPITTTNVPVATCTAAAAAAGNSYVQVTCTNATTGPIGVASCTPAAAAAGNSYIATTCNTVTTTNVAVATCTAAAAAAGNSWTATTCPAPVVTTNVPVATCTPAGAAAGNSWTATTCATNNTAGVPVASCTASAAAAGNNYTTTTCATNNTTNVPVAACTASGPTAGNLYVNTTCNTATTTNVAVASCTPATASAGNSWTDVTCNTNNTSNVPVASCTASGPTAGNGYTTTTCPAPVLTTNVPVASCTPAAASAGNSWTATTCTTGSSVPTGVASCTPVAPTAANGYVTTTCATLTTGPTGVAACTNAAADAGNSWTTTTCNLVATTDVPSAVCTPTAASGANGYTSTTCNTVVTPDVLTATCTPSAANAGNSYVATTCTPAPGEKVQVQTTTTVFTTQFGRNSASTVTNSGWSDLDGVCYASASLPSTKPTLASLATKPATPGGCSAWPCTTSTAFEGSTDSLADVAQYYYATDLRPSLVDNVKTKVIGPEDDRVEWQHMSTFALALGVSGTLDFRSNYKTDVTSTDTDFAKIRALDPTNPAGERLEPSLAWPQWPVPSIDYSNKDNWNDARSIDDFWHAAVNGRGQFFSARSPRDVVNGIGGSLAAIKASSAGAPAGTSSLQPVVGNNFAYTAGYETRKWIGDLRSTQIDLTTGNISATPDWSAQALLNAKTGAACDNRKIYLLRQGATNNQVNFSWNTRACDSSGAPTGSADTGLNSTEQAYFNASVVQLLSHYPEMTDGTVTPVDQRALAADANMVNYLRGQRGLENFDPGDANKLYRVRSAVLGDIVNAQPVFVKAPSNQYKDTGYDAFKSSNSGRIPMVYVGANDGMLHAFHAGVDASDPLKGQEAWAVIPSAVLPKLYKLADNNYQDTHEFFVDGTPTVGDAYDAVNGAWKTVLVGGFNSGGKGYYALDVTDPLAPKALWEFKWSDTCYDGTAATAGADCHLGYTFGRPVISKLADGTWVVFVTSGHNNINATAKTGDGQGYLYVLDAFSGKIIHKIDTGAGDATTPSGLTQVSNWVDNVTNDNTTLRLYGGDLLGNIWRFDVNGILPPSGVEATLIGVTKDSSGNLQPITTAMELAELNGKPMVFVGTGRLLGASDLSDTRTQSIYGIVDNPQSGTTVYTDLRSALRPMGLTQIGTEMSAVRKSACTGGTAECAGTDGWVVDLPDSGERVNIDMNLQFGTLIVGSNVPGTNPCDFSGYSWLNYFDFATGSAVTSSPGQTVSQYLANSLLVGLSVYRLPPPTGGCKGSDCEKLIVAGSLAPGGFGYGNPPERVNPPAGKRISWREITQ